MGQGDYKMNTKPVARALSIMALAAIAGFYVWQAVTVPTMTYDEPLWFNRSRTWPWKVSQPFQRDWDTDVPGLNRLVWGCALRLTGTNIIPKGEPPFLTAADGPRNAYEWSLTKRPCPRKAILVMRGVNLAVFFTLLGGAYATFRRMGYGRGRAFLALCFVAAIPRWWMRDWPAAYKCSSGDVFLACAGVWTLYALFGSRTWRNAVLAGVIAGLATSSKHTGALLVVAAALTYWRFPARALVVGVVAFGVFVAVNPIVALDAAGPVAVLRDMIERRGALVALLDKGQSVWHELFEHCAVWVVAGAVSPIFAVYARQRTLALWCVIFAGGTLVGFQALPLLHVQYLLPLELAAVMTVSVAVPALEPSWKARALAMSLSSCSWMKRSPGVAPTLLWERWSKGLCDVSLWCVRKLNGAPRETRTRDPLIKNQLLYQLS